MKVKRLMGKILRTKRGGRVSPEGTARWIELKNVPMDVISNDHEILYYKIVPNLLYGRVRGHLTWELNKESWEKRHGNKA